jgi:hypothetical protein
VADNWSETLKLADIEKRNGLPDGWLSVQLNAESAGDPNAVSPAGAQGLFQFMPATAAELGIDPFDPQQAAEAAGRYNGQLFQKYGGDPQKAAAAYNWGMGNVDKFGLERAPKETRNYVQKIVSSLPEAGRQLAGAFTIGEARAEDLPDASGYSDEELDSIINGSNNQQSSIETIDASGYSDEELDAIINGNDDFSSAKDVGIVYPATGDVYKASSGDADDRPMLGRDLNPLEGFAAPFINMLGDNGLGIADEVAGTAGGLTSLAMGGGFNEGYDPAANRINAIERQFEEQYPNLARYSSALGVLGGGKAIADRGVASLEKYAPKAFSAAKNWAAANKWKSRALLGAGANAVQSYLAETGDDRLPAAGVGAGIGAIAGPIGGAVADRVLPKLAAVADRTAPVLGRALETARGRLPAKTDADKLASLAAGRDASYYRSDIEPTLDVSPATPATPVYSYAPSYGKSQISPADYRNDQLWAKQNNIALDQYGKPQINFIQVGEREPTFAEFYGDKLIKDYENGVPLKAQRLTDPVETQKAVLNAQKQVPAPSKTEPTLKTASGQWLTSEQVFDNARSLFKAADNAGGTIKSDKVDAYFDSLQDIVPDDRVSLTLDKNNPVRAIVNDMQQLRGRPLTLQEAEKFDRILTKHLQEPRYHNDQTGKLNDLGNELNTVQQRFRSLMEDAGEDSMEGGANGFKAYKAAVKEWARGIRLRTLESDLEYAQSKDNVAVALKNRMAMRYQQLKKNPKGFSPAEIEAIGKAGQTGVLTGGLRILGSRLLSTISGAAAGAPGGIAGSAAGIGAAHGLAYAARRGAERLQTNRFNKVRRVVSGQVPQLDKSLVEGASALGIATGLAADSFYRDRKK